MTCETVVTETPARRATSAIVTMRTILSHASPDRGVRFASACGQAFAPVLSNLHDPFGGPVTLHPVVADVTARIQARSAATRSAYLERIAAAARQGPARSAHGCANLAHGLAACGADEKLLLKAAERRNIAI